jgi:hypothetical protein
MNTDRAVADLKPRMVSIYELRAKLLPLMAGCPWAEDALMDLWKKGAPDPSPSSMPCPPGSCRFEQAGGEPCGKWGCRREKRVLLPAQFAAWWQDVARRQGLDLTAGQAAEGKHGLRLRVKRPWHGRRRNGRDG